jgi:hypothetical protein
VVKITVGNGAQTISSPSFSVEVYDCLNLVNRAEDYPIAIANSISDLTKTTTITKAAGMAKFVSSAACGDAINSLYLV